jgi:hypothetical protein
LFGVSRARLHVLSPGLISPLMVAHVGGVGREMGNVGYGEGGLGIGRGWPLWVPFHFEEAKHFVVTGGDDAGAFGFD